MADIHESNGAIQRLQNARGHVAGYFSTSETANRPWRVSPYLGSNNLIDEIARSASSSNYR
jgi:hypothetical protein